MVWQKMGSPEMITRDDPVSQSAVKRREDNRAAVQALAEKLASLALQYQTSRSTSDEDMNANMSTVEARSPDCQNLALPPNGDGIIREAIVASGLHLDGNDEAYKHLLALLHDQQMEITKLLEFREKIEGFLEKAYIRHPAMQDTSDIYTQREQSFPNNSPDISKMDANRPEVLDSVVESDFFVDLDFSLDSIQEQSLYVDKVHTTKLSHLLQARKRQIEQKMLTVKRSSAEDHTTFQLEVICTIV